MPKSKQIEVIIMEDDVAMGQVLSNKLVINGFNVRHALDGRQGLKMIGEKLPDLIVMDLMMPEMDGFEVLESIRKNPDKKVANLKVIVLSNINNNDSMLRLHTLKADDFLVKAYFTPNDILGKIKEVLLKKNN